MLTTAGAPGYRARRVLGLLLAAATAEAGTYAGILRRVLAAGSQTTVAGPAAYSGVFNDAWLQGVAHPGEQLTDHFYPATGCGPAEPTPHTLTAPATRRRETHYLESLVTQATSRGAPVPARWTPCTWSPGSRRPR